MHPDSSSIPTVRDASFLAGAGPMAKLILDFDWARTSLGAIDGWPAHVRCATATMLRSQVAMVMLWGEDGVMLYNGAYSAIAGRRHPGLLGSKVREGWPEVAAFNDHVMQMGLQGKVLSFRDQELTLHRNGRAERVWLDLDYSPLPDAEGRPAGVMAIVVETTAKVQALHHLSGERERLAQLFAQAPGFMAMLRGPTHVFELANPAYLQLVGNRPVLGKGVAEALPDAAAQGYLELLDRVYRSGEPFNASGFRYLRQDDAGGPPVARYVDFVYQPVRDANGAVDGIFVEGVDVTSRTLAEIRREALMALGARFEQARSPADVAYAAAETLGRNLGVSRVGYGSIDAETDVLEVERDWCAPGVETLAGVTRMRDYGSYIDGLKRNEFIAIEDVRLDPRTSATAAALEGKSARSFVNIPVHEHGRLVAMFFVNDAAVRAWSQEELDFIQDVGQRTRVTAERLRSEAARRDSERRLREVNETLEAKVEARTRELMAVEEQYRHAQKMEAIGQLTGGIAHDFNNMLHGIGMSVEVLQRMLESGRLDNWERYIGQSQRSIQRAAALTHRLLAFSRRQALDPRPTDVARLVGGLEDLVRGTVGPSVALEIAAPGSLWQSRVDGPQLENAVLNLCINARDAMQPGGGSLCIALANVQLAPNEAGALGLPAGDYVRITVSDTGAGMPPEVQARAFDPFFTTKAQGEGTGLGLSMVYGFVRQSEGQVRIDSQVGRGTDIHLFLPRAPDGYDGAVPTTRDGP
jgi:PAS domain S-box-containing protein